MLIRAENKIGEIDKPWAGGYDFSWLWKTDSGDVVRSSMWIAPADVGEAVDPLEYHTPKKD